jgi:hypothetical protein
MVANPGSGTPAGRRTLPALLALRAVTPRGVLARPGLWSSGATRRGTSTQRQEGSLADRQPIDERDLSTASWRPRPT